MAVAIEVGRTDGLQVFNASHLSKYTFEAREHPSR